MVGVNNVVQDAICECFEGIMIEPCLLQPCFHVAGAFALHKTGMGMTPGLGGAPHALEFQRAQRDSLSECLL